MDKGFQPSWNYNTTYSNLLSEKKKKKSGKYRKFWSITKNV